MTSKIKKPFYGLVALISSTMISVTFLIIGIFIFYFYSLILGIIIFSIGLYGIFSYLISIYLINPVNCLDFSNILELKGNEIILDDGCGLGRATIGAAKLLNTGKIIGVDIWDKFEIIGNSLEKAYENAEIEGVREKVDFCYGDSFDLPFENCYFDIVICSGLITSFYNDKKKLKAIQEIYRVLKTNGTFLMREPVKKLKTLIILTPLILLIRLPSKNHWIVLLEKSGFRKIKYYPHRIAGSFKMIKL